MHRHALPAVMAGLLFLLLPVPSAGEQREDTRFPATIERWVWHFDDSMSDDVGPTYTAWLQVLPPDAEVVVAITDMVSMRRAAGWLETQGRLDPRIRFVRVPGPISPWARDRYLIVDHPDRREALVPPAAVVSEIWSGDPGVARVVAAVDGGLPVRGSIFGLEGGDLVLTPDAAIVGWESVAVDAERMRMEFDDVVTRLERDLGRRVIVLGAGSFDALPHVHADMYLAWAGGKRLVLGDPRLADPYFDAIGDLGLDEGPVRDFGNLTRLTQQALAPRYDALHEQLVAEGFEVHRIPIIHGEGDVVLTWTNVVLEARGGRRHAYVPTYGVPFLDRAAGAVWSRLGCTVSRVDCERSILQGGALRCLSNVIRRR